jgi:uncharacterized protein YkwD
MSERFRAKVLTSRHHDRYHLRHDAVAGPSTQRKGPVIPGVLMLRRALTIALAFASLVIGSTGPAAAATRFDQKLQNTSAQSDLIALVNAYRAGNGLQLVSSSSALTAAATWMAGDMAAKNYIGHVSSDGRSPTQRMSAFGYPATSMYTGENLAAGYPSAGAVITGWQASGAHNAVLLNPNYNAVGIGLVYNPSSAYKWYWAADFGGPGGTVKVIVPPPPPPPSPPPLPVAPARPATLRETQPVAERAAAAPRSAVAQPAQETVDPEAQTQAAEIALMEATARRITHFFAVLHRMGAV